MQVRSNNIWQRMLAIDRRILYLLLFANIVFFLVVPVSLKAPVSPPAQQFYDTLENLKPGELVMISSNWSASTWAENQPQLEAVIRHLIKKKLRFTIISAEPQARDLSYRIAQRITAEANYQYGKDWAHFGFVPNLVVSVKGMVNSIPETIKKDIRGEAVERLPLLQRVSTLSGYKVVVELAAGATVGAWISYAPKELSILYCPTSVMAAEAYTFLDSGQIKGMITGAKGAYEYEQLIGFVGLGTPFAMAISFSHGLIIVFIFLGNLAMFMSRRRD